MNKTGYTNGNSLPIHQDNGSRNRRLPKNIKSIRDMTKHTLTIKPNDIPKWLVDSSYAIQPDIHRHINDNRLSNNIQNIMQTKIKHQELYRGQDGITMGQILWTRHFLAEEGPHVPTTKNLRRQQDYHPTGRKQQNLYHKENPTPKCTIFMRVESKNEFYATTNMLANFQNTVLYMILTINDMDIA